MISSTQRRFRRYRHTCLIIIWLSFAVVSCGKSEGPVKPDPIPANTFSNPIIKGADPAVYQKDGTYYYLHTTGNSIRLWKTSSMTGLNAAIPKTVYTPVPGSENSSNIWAPEITFIDGKWYIYYSAGDGEDSSQRTWVLENSNSDPMQGTWMDKGEIGRADADHWAIDGTVMEYKGDRYFLWSGRPDETNADLTQYIYISKMSDPWTLEGDASQIAEPEHAWEKKGFGVNEAPQILRTSGDAIYMTYSASFCGTDDYALGIMSLKSGGDPLSKSDWTKVSEPVFTQKPVNSTFGPGHNSFFKSADGTETWIIYHANSFSNQGCADQRNVRMQKINFNADGSPNFGEPVATGLQIRKPSGE